MNSLMRCCGCLLGLAGGDAVGTTVEFRSRGTFSPVTGLVGGGPLDLKPGAMGDQVTERTTENLPYSTIG